MSPASSQEIRDSSEVYSVQLAQSGSALICVILHTQGNQTPDQQHMFIVALEGLSACISVLRHLGERVSRQIASIASITSTHALDFV